VSDTATEGRFLVADLGTARLGFGIDRVLEVFALTAMAGVPWSPPWVMGAVYRSGRVVTVVDLGRCLHFETVRPPTVGLLVEQPDGVAVAFAVGGVEVVEARHSVQITDVRLHLDDTEAIIASLSTPDFDFHHLDVDRVLTAVAEAF
jgi:chemotaxis signal transduction protein